MVSPCEVWQLSVPRRLLKVFAKSEKSKCTRRHRRQVCFWIPTRLKFHLSPRARLPTAIMRHLCGVGARVSEVPMRNGPQRVTRHQIQATVGSTGGSKIKKAG